MRRKFYFGVIACLALASCSQDELLMDSSPSESAIGFATHVDNSSRGVVDAAKANIYQFKVWAAKTRNAGTSGSVFSIMTGQEVNKQADGSWTYTPQRYWIKNNAYLFNAFACNPATGASYYTYTLPSSVAQGDFSKYYQGTLTYNNDATSGANGNVDLVWANKQILTITDQNPAPDVVNFTFGHLLCKVNMKFINEFTTGSDNIAIYDASIENANAGTLNLSAFSTNTPISNLKWDTSNAAETSIAYRFAGNNAYKEIASGGYVSTEYKTIIPNQEKITVSFKVKTPLMWNNDQDDCIEIHTVLDPSKLVGNDKGFQCGYSYTLVAHINVKTLGDLAPIKFSLEKVEDFVTFQNPGSTEFMVDLTPSESSVSSTDPDYVSVHVNSIKAKDLVFLGDFVAADYSYEWTITGPDGAKSTAVFKDTNSTTKTIAKGGYTSMSDMFVEILATPNKNQDDSETYTLKLQIKNGDTIVGQDTATITISYPQSLGGGSNDGDDNDG